MKTEMKIKIEKTGVPAPAVVCLAPDREVWEVESDDSDVEVLAVERPRPMASLKLDVPEASCEEERSWKILQDVFSYIDKVTTDFEMFKTYVHGIEQQNTAAAALVQRMKQHELFPRFCEEVGAEAGLWGLEAEHAPTELSLFEEWLAEKEQSLINAAMVNGTSAEHQATKAMNVAANAETQVEEEYDEVEASQNIPLPPADIDGESLAEDELPLARVLDMEFGRAAAGAESSSVPAARSVDVDMMLQAQKRRNDERDRLVAESAAVRDFRAGKEMSVAMTTSGEDRKPGEVDPAATAEVEKESCYKYPMKDISRGLLDEVDAMNREAEPPRYGDQQCVRRGRKKAAVDEDSQDGEKMDADEVMIDMEEHCKRESVEVSKTKRKATKKEEVEQEPGDDNEGSEAEEEEDDMCEEDEEDTPQRGKGNKVEKVLKRGKAKNVEDEEEQPKRGKAKKVEDEEEKPKRGKARKVDDEEEQPKRGKANKVEDEEEQPKRGKAKKVEDEDEQPKRGKAKKVQDEEEQPKRGKAKKAEDEEPKRGKGKKVEDEEERPKRGKAKKVEDEEDVPKRGKAKKVEDEEEQPKRGKAKKVEDEEDEPKVNKGKKAKKAPEEEEEDVPKLGKGRCKQMRAETEVQEKPQGRVKYEEGAMVIEDDEDLGEPDEGSEMEAWEEEEEKSQSEEDVPQRANAKKVEDEKEKPKRGKAKKVEDEEEQPKRGKAKKVEDEQKPKRGKAKKAEDEEDDVPKRGKDKKVEDEEPKRGKAKKVEDDEEKPKRGKAKKVDDEEDVPKVGKGMCKQMRAETEVQQGKPKKAKTRHAAAEEDESEKSERELGMIVPPEHVQANHIYSNAYRFSLALGHDLEAARARARTAADEFRRSGRVPVDYVNGAFIIESDEEDDVDMATPVRKKFMLHGLVCPNRRGWIDFSFDPWDDAKQLGQHVGIVGVGSFDDGVKRELFNSPKTPMPAQGDAVQRAKDFLARRTKAKTAAVPAVGDQDGQGWLLPAAPKGPIRAAMNPSIPVNQAMNPSVPVNQAMNPSIPVNQAMNPSVPVNQAMNPSVPVNQAMNPSVPVNQAMNPSVPVLQAMNPSVPVNQAVNPGGPVKEALTPPPKATANSLVMVANPSVPVKNEMMGVLRSPPPRAAASAVVAPKPAPLVKSCAVPPPAACITPVVPAKAVAACPAPKTSLPALPAVAASAAKSVAEPGKAVEQVNKKAKMAPPANPPKKPSAPSNPPPKAAAPSNPVVPSPANPDEQNVMKAVGRLHVMNEEMAIFPETYDERQSLYACFKRKLKKGDEVPQEFATLWVQACGSNSRSAKTALFHKWLTAGKDFGRLSIQLDRSRTDATRGSQRMGWQTRAQLLHLHQHEETVNAIIAAKVLVDMSYVNEHETRAATRLLGGNVYQNLGTNTMYGASGPAETTGTGNVGCLGMPGGSSSDGASKGSQKGKGKGKGKGGQGIETLHPNGQPKFGKKKKLLLCIYIVGQSQLEDVMPGNATEAAVWCMTKLIKAMGDAKTLSVRLACVKHQEQLCTLLKTHSTELETSYSQIQALKVAEVPDSQLYAAAELCRQRLALFSEDRASANRVCPKPKKTKKDWTT
ncbi:MDN1 [Symbiodinium sp. CCMP2592]|nr:MDN1 [Symbiodinium sp. CCMP2592]